MFNGEEGRRGGAKRGEESHFSLCTFLFLKGGESERRRPRWRYFDLLPDYKPDQGK